MKNLLVILCVVMLSMVSPLSANADCAGGICRPAAAVVRVAKSRPVRKLLSIRLLPRRR